MIIRLAAIMLCPILLLSLSAVVTADDNPNCRQAQQRFEDAQRRSRKPLSRSTQAALADITVASLKDKLATPIDARNGILERYTPPIGTKDQRLIVKRMVAVFCEIIFSQEAPSDNTKFDQINEIAEKVSEAEPFVPEATTQQRDASLLEIPNRLDIARVVVVPAAFDAAAERRIAQGPDEPTADVESEFLAEPPYVVNVTNKYFVIVASSGSKERGIRAMNELKSTAAEYDFALYPPYRGNPNYAIMMASWVSADVAKDAQKEGLRVVKRWLGDKFVATRDTPFIWCYPNGSC